MMTSFQERSWQVIGGFHQELILLTIFIDSFVLLKSVLMKYAGGTQLLMMITILYGIV